MIREGPVTAYLLGEPQSGLRAADREGRSALMRSADESSSFRNESSSTSTLIEKQSYASNITWVVDNHQGGRPKEK
jgi:hypothetical protein